MAIILSILGIYLATGALFAIAFVLKGVQKIDPAAREAGWGFRLLIFPGVVALWPLMASRWMRGVTHPPPERNAHRRLASKTGRNREEGPAA